MAVRHYTVEAQEFARVIELPLSEWPMRCFEVASYIHQSGLLLQPTAVRYGMYYGPIAENSPFATELARHGWLQNLTNHEILDPTRWVFEGLSPPQAYIARISRRSKEYREYDVGGSRLRAIHAAPKPEAAACRELAAPWSEKFVIEWPRGVLGYIKSLFGDEVLYRAQIHWLANQTPEMLGVYAKGVYTAIIEQAPHGRALIPIDYQQVVFNDVYGSLVPPKPKSRAKSKAKRK